MSGIGWCRTWLNDSAGSHARFPNAAAHFRKIKCVSCHTRADEPLALRWHHLQRALWQHASYGLGLRSLARLLGADDDPYEPGYGPREVAAARGYRALEDRPGARVEAGIAPDRLAGIMNMLRARLRERVALEDVPRAAFARQRARAAAHGIDLVYFSVPHSVGDATLDALVAVGDVERYLRLNDPERFPALFQARERVDMVHLTRAGAERLSRRFAAEAAALWR